MTITRIVEADVLIVGMGFTGLIIAHHLSRGLRTVIIDSAPFVNHRPCAGVLVEPSWQHPWMKDLIEISSVRPFKLQARIIDIDIECQISQDRIYHNIDKSILLKHLFVSLPSCINALSCTKLTGMRNDSSSIYCNLFDMKAKNSITIRTKWVIGADGSHSTVRRLSGIGWSNVPICTVFQALVSTNKDSKIEEAFDMILDSTLTDYYGWRVPKNGHILIGLAIAQEKHSGKNALKRLATRMGYSKYQEIYGSSFRRPFLYNHLATGQGRVLLVGEAAGFISPFSGEGISYSLASAQAATEILDDLPEGSADDYAEKVEPLKKSIIERGEMALSFYGKPEKRKSYYLSKG